MRAHWEEIAPRRKHTDPSHSWILCHQWGVEMFCGLEGRGGLWLKYGHISLHNYGVFTSPGLGFLLHKMGAEVVVQTRDI